MRKNLTILIAFLSIVAVNAQSPNKISYQAVIRDSENQLVANSNVGMQISILQGIEVASATAVYVERQFPTTNKNGLATIQIGGEDVTVISGVFSEIDWSAENHYIKTETDVNGGSNYNISGTSQLLSVPYALYAKYVENNDDADADAYNEIQDISLSGKDLSIDHGSTITLNVDDADADPTNEIQSLSLTGHTLALSGGGEVTIPDDVNDEDNDPSNEIQDISMTGNELSISNGSSVTIPQNTFDFSSFGDTLFTGDGNWLIIPGLSEANYNSGNNTISDYDGNIYGAVMIGDQVWMAENLKSLHYADGSLILNSSDYNADINYRNIYGRLYTWYDVMDGKTSSDGIPSNVQGVCPDGWHVPSNMEWNELIEFIDIYANMEGDGSAVAGGLLKEEGLNHWQEPNTGAKDRYGFRALPAGYKLSATNFIHIGNMTYFWTCTEQQDVTSNAYTINIRYENSIVKRETSAKIYGFSVRCVKD